MLAKAKEATKEALVKAHETKPEAKGAVEATNVTEYSMKDGFQVDLEKAKQAQETAQGAMTAAANLMFTFYSNLLSPESKYAWNKIVVKQTESNPFVNLQGVSLEGPRGMLRNSFNDCMMFHLLTEFPINAAEQEKYFILNILKKPQRINVHQFIGRVEQLNAYISQMPCFYYSPNANASTKPENIPFTEAELWAHVLRMCPIQWQDQYNMNKKGMMPMDMRLLLILLEAIECVCTYEKGKLESFEKSSHKSKKGKKRPGTKLGCLFLQEFSGFLFFPLLWRFFHRNHNSCSAVTFSEHHQETCLYGAYVESYVGYQFVRQKQSTIQFYGTLRWLLSTITLQLEKLGKSIILPRPFSPYGVFIRRGHLGQTVLQSELLVWATLL